jgi:hypothetical protein
MESQFAKDWICGGSGINWIEMERSGDREARSQKKKGKHPENLSTLP